MMRKLTQCIFKVQIPEVYVKYFLLLSYKVTQLHFVNKKLILSDNVRLGDKYKISTARR